MRIYSKFPQIGLVAACEPGGAEVLSAMIKDMEEPPFLCLEGNARQIFLNKLRGELSLVDFSDLKQLSVFGLVLTGTSAFSNLERDVIAWARGRGYRTASVLDHWVNYRSRFGSADCWRENLPDEVWISDDDAYRIAVAEGFPEDCLVRVENPHCAEIIERIQLLMKAQGDRQERRLLFMSEPISSDAKLRTGSEVGFGFTEFDIVKQLQSFCGQLERYFDKVVIRPHPLEDPKKYDFVLKDKSNKGFFVLSTQQDYLEDIVQSTEVIGIQSIGLVWALWAGRRVHSIVVGQKLRRGLPHLEILRHSSVADFVGAL